MTESGWLSISRFKLNVPHGPFLAFRANGDVERGIWNNGKLDGDWSCKYTSGITKVIVYNNGVNVKALKSE